MLSYVRIEQFRKDLPTIRAFAGWSVADLSDMLGVCRATMVRAEGVNGKLTVIQYLAISKLIDNEIRFNKNDALLRVMYILDGSDESIDRDYLISETKRITKSVGRKAGMDTVKQVMTRWLTAV